MRYEVVWAHVAENDLISIIEHIAQDNPLNASRILKRIKDKASNLTDSPERGRLVPELLDQGISKYRELVIPPWRVIYRIGQDRVYVLSVLDSRRNIEDVLLNRLIGLKGSSLV